MCLYILYTVLCSRTLSSSSWHTVLTCKTLVHTCNCCWNRSLLYMKWTVLRFHSFAMETILTKTDNHIGIRRLSESDVVAAWWAHNSFFQEGIACLLANAQTLENVLLAYCGWKKKTELIMQSNPIITVSVIQSMANHGGQNPSSTMLVSAT